ncbi:hypothetical protein EH223_10545 [candidate division KSB1 bacterium]|nr:hypothetical protein [candidate division KSB1 bacterium]RQW03196.1 MAG: hypothetical protein EH223_10545 [candidate division KSB1 bacterium]
MLKLRTIVWLLVALCAFAMLLDCYTQFKGPEKKPIHREPPLVPTAPIKPMLAAQRQTTTSELFFEISGWTNPRTTVVIKGGAQSRQIVSDENGRFNLLVPLRAKQQNRLCATAFWGSLASQPTCIDVLHKPQPAPIVEAPKGRYVLARERIKIPLPVSTESRQSFQPAQGIIQERLALPPRSKIYFETVPLEIKITNVQVDVESKIFSFDVAVKNTSTLSAFSPIKATIKNIYPREAQVRVKNADNREESAGALWHYGGFVGDDQELVANEESDSRTWQFVNTKLQMFSFTLEVDGRLNGPGLPPDPAEVAPELDPTIATNMIDATKFLYEGPNAIQTGVDSGTIEPKRVAVLRGKVKDKDNNPLEAVTITIFDHPEYGQTLSREDGQFDMVVNGGGLFVVSLNKNGYLPLRRKMKTSWQDYSLVPEVVMIKKDSNATAIDLSATAMQQVRGSEIVDSDGTRQATLLFPQGIQAEIILPDSSTQPVSNLNVRVTEYSVGEDGPKRMPAELPANVGYTYCFELSADETVAKVNGKDVILSQPIILHTENFLNFPTGLDVPVGYYDNDKNAWIPSQNGRVIEILDITDGKAVLDVEGDGYPADSLALDSLGITNEELTKLAGLYLQGQSLWRVSISHFSTWDCNWPYGPPDDATTSTGEPPTGDETEDDPCQTSGFSSIECQNQILGEEENIVGTPFSLHYTSGRVPGRITTYKLVIPLSGDSVPASLKRIELDIEVAGQRLVQNFPAESNQNYTFTWNGLDSYGRKLQGAQPITVRTGYVYDAVYQESAQSGQAFAQFSGIPITGSRARQEVTLWQEWQRSIGLWDARALGLGGWTLNMHHAYNPLSHVLLLGNGRRRSAEALAGIGIITTVAGNGISGFNGDGGLANEASLRSPYDTAIGPDGSLFIVDTWNQRVRKVEPYGVIKTIAGNGTSGFDGDGGPAVQAKLSYPKGIAVGPDGSIYIADTGNDRIRRVDPNGIITTIAGSGNPSGPRGDGGPATEAKLRVPEGVDIASDGSLYIADTQHDGGIQGLIRRVGPDGIITTVAGFVRTGGSYYRDGVPATSVYIDLPRDVAVGPDGCFYFSTVGAWSTDDYSYVRRVGSDGIISTAAGGGYSQADGIPATTAAVYGVTGLDVDSDGSLFIAEKRKSSIRDVSPDGIITTVAGVYNKYGFGGDGGPATQAKLHHPNDVVAGPDGSIYIADTNNNRVRKLDSALPGFSLSDILIPNEEGKELYVFNRHGRHLRTLDALTGATRYEFSYDSTDRLITVTDGDGNITTIERDADGDPTAIIGPYGQRTRLALDPNGYLASITNPTEESTRFSYTSDGLLVSKIDPKNNLYEYTYSKSGRLERADDPAGGSQTLERSEVGAIYEVARTTELDRVTTYRVESLSTGDRRRLNTFPDSTQAEVFISKDGSRKTALPNGTVIDLVEGPDPRWGMLAPITKSITTITPTGLSFNVTTQRSVTLADPNNQLSLQSSRDTVKINDHIYTSVYESATRTFTDTSPEGRQSAATIDSLGRVVLSQKGDLAPLHFEYDSRGRMSSITQESGGDIRHIGLGYNTDGFLETVIDPLEREARFIRDKAGRLKQEMLPGDRLIKYDHDNSGNIITITPPGRPAHSFTYTPVNLIKTYTPPDIGMENHQTVYNYNADRQRTDVALPDGRSIHFGYDSAGRQETVTIARGILRYGYDPVTGELATVTAPDGGILSYSYDGSLLTQTTWSNLVQGSVSRSYDNNFRITSLSVNGANPVTFQYDDDDLCVKAGDLSLGYDAQNGRLTSTVLGNVNDIRSYNTFADLVGYNAAYNNTPLYTTSCTRDDLGRISEQIETIDGMTTTFNFVYDAAGRLANVRHDGILVADYTYDDNANRLSFTDSEGGTINGTYDAQDRLLQYGAVFYSYTENGDLLSKTVDSQVTTYEYDELGNLIAVSLPDGTRIQYLIDGLNRRIGKRINGIDVQRFLYQDRLKPIAELDGANNVVSRFIYAGHINVPDYMIREGIIYRIITDCLGSPRLVVNATTGKIVQRMDYDEFGKIIYDSNPGFQPFGFAGGIYDPDTRLIRFGTRDYDPDIGRWTIKDPLLFGGGDTNLYAYVGNDPINLVDLDGLQLTAVLKTAAKFLAQQAAQNVMENPDDQLLGTEETPPFLDAMRRDIDGDGMLDFEDPDIDGDLIPNEVDDEPFVPFLPPDTINTPDYKEILRLECIARGWEFKKPSPYWFWRNRKKVPFKWRSSQ